MSGERGLPVDFIRRVNSTNHLENAWARFERSELDLDGFDAAFAEEARALGHDVRGKDIIPLLRGAVRPEMVEALKRIKQRHKTGCITNNVPSMQAAPRMRAAFYAREIMELFDHVIESSKAGIRKPNPRIYQMMCETLEVLPEAVRLSRRSRRQLEACPRHGHDDHQGRNRPASDCRTRSGDGDDADLVL
jgi:putative hydrolase of the HAD superfamily